MMSLNDPSSKFLLPWRKNEFSHHSFILFSYKNGLLAGREGGLSRPNLEKGHSKSLETIQKPPKKTFKKHADYLPGRRM